jgi:hypothetical protein
MVSIEEKREIKSVGTRFGGISPSVLRELSGVYQPFVKAIKEIISNSYDADANNVYLIFKDDYKHLSIEDDGHGMNPIEFIRDYIRIGKSLAKEEYTKSGRPRIGGKGIGFLAPARYCESIKVTTKKSGISNSFLYLEPKGNLDINLSDILTNGVNDDLILNYIKIDRVTDKNDNKIDAVIEGYVIKLSNSIDEIKVWYSFDSSNIELSAIINFERLFSLDSSKSLEEIDNFCEVSLRKVNEEEKSKSYTKIVLNQINEFVQFELGKKGKKGARNVESYKGIDQFLWNLSRTIPIKSNIHKNIPNEINEFICNDIDGENRGYILNVHYSLNEIDFKPLTRQLVQPVEQLTMEDDGDIVKLINYQDEKMEIKGFLIGQSTTIFPAESRGILIRVKGVGIGEPTYFDLDRKFTGSSKVALSQISGEINIIRGTNAIEDINPGREGFYKESQIYNFIKEMLIGEDNERYFGLLKDVMDAIILRSEVRASINNFIKKYEAQRTAIKETAMTIGELGTINPDLEDKFFIEKDNYEMTLSPAVQYKAEGKLASYEVNLVEGIDTPYKIDYVNKKLLLNKDADIWRRNISIRGINFDIIYKLAKNSNLFCEVNPKGKKIFINWNHPMRSSMGDNTYIKHCLATVASDLPQDQLNNYIQVVTNKVR